MTVPREREPRTAAAMLGQTMLDMTRAGETTKAMETACCPMKLGPVAAMSTGGMMEMRRRSAAGGNDEPGDCKRDAQNYFSDSQRSIHPYC